MMNNPIPVAEARRLAEQYAKSMLVILAYDPPSQQTNAVSYGVSPADKEQAADAAELCARVVCGEAFQRRATHEDYRFADEGRRQQAIDELVRAATGARHAILSVLAYREGITNVALQNTVDALTVAIERGRLVT